MSIELERDIINYEKLIGEGLSQTMVEGDIIISERNPEVMSILNTYGNVIIQSCEAIDNRVIVEGNMSFNILYSSQDGNNGIYKVNATSNFTHNIEIPGTEAHMSCKVVPDIEHIEYEIVNAKRIKVSAIINMKAMAYNKEQIEGIRDIKGEDIQILREFKEINEFLDENKTQSIIKGKIEVDKDEPEIENILKTNVHVHKKEVIIADGKVSINACALIRVIYDTKENKACMMEKDVPFTQEFSMDNMKLDSKCDVTFKVDDIADEVKEDENGERRIIEVEISVNVNSKVYSKREIQSILDAYSPKERYDIEHQDIRMISFLGEGSEETAIKEKISIPDDMDPVAEIRMVDVLPSITDIKIVDDKVLVEGVSSCCIVYSKVNEEGGTISYIEEIPFKSTVDVPGAKMDMMHQADINVEHISYSMSSNREIDIKVTLQALVKVYSKILMNVVKGVQEQETDEMSKNMPSIVIYFVQPHDTLWKIAKKYYTTVEDIAAINEIQDPDKINVGMKLIIPKKVMDK